MSGISSTGSSSTGTTLNIPAISDLTSRLRTFSFSEKTTVIIEIGYRFTKVGFAGEAKPRSNLPTRTIPQTGGSAEETTNIFEIDNEAQLRFALIDFINHIFIRHMLLTPKDKTVIISEPLFMPLWFRKVLLHVLFCDIQVSSVFVAPGSLFALFALGWRSGLVVESDVLETTVLPVFENIPILKAVESVSVGYADVVDGVRLKLIADEPPWPKPELEDICAVDDIIKCTDCFVDRFDRVCARRSGKTVSPSAGSILYPSTFGGKCSPFAVSGEIRESTGEPLFGEEGDSSVTMAVLNALDKCPVDVRRVLAERLVLVGCCSSLPGFGNRLCSELQAATSNGSYGGQRLPASVSSLNSFKVAQPSVPAENIVWFGASIFGHLEVAMQRAITRDKYYTEIKLTGHSEFNCSKVLAADWLTTPSLIPYPGELTVTDPTSSTC